jgi:GNAT superfamily N-acetyltransferase
LLHEHHRCAAFTSGTPSLDDWIKRRALANQASGASRTYVTCDGEDVVGYHALAAGGVDVATAPGRFRRNMPDPIPVVILARLAVDRNHQGRGLGRALFQDAARRILYAAEAIGIRGILVHAVSDAAKNFYLALGFEPSAIDPLILMVTLSDVRKALEP